MKKKKNEAPERRGLSVPWTQMKGNPKRGVEKKETPGEAPEGHWDKM